MLAVNSVSDFLYFFLLSDSPFAKSVHADCPVHLYCKCFAKCDSFSHVSNKSAFAAGSVGHMGVESQPSVAVAQMTLESASPAQLTHLTTEGSSVASGAQLRMEGAPMGVDSQAAVAVQSLLDSQQSQDTSG